MALTVTQITGRVAAPDGTNLANTKIEFALTGFDTDDTNDITVVSTPIFATVDESGDIDINLHPNEGGVRSRFYEVTAEINLADAVKRYPIGLIEVPMSSGPYDLNDLLTVSPPDGVTVDQYLAQLVSAESSAAASAVSAAASAALALGVVDSVEITFPTVADLSASPLALPNGLYAQVSSGQNGEYEIFQIDTASTLTANGTTIVALTGSAGRAISTNTDFASISGIIADLRTFPDNTIATTANATFKSVSTGEDFTSSGGQGFKVETSPTFQHLDQSAADEAALFPNGTAFEVAGLRYVRDDAVLLADSAFVDFSVAGVRDAEFIIQGGKKYRMISCILRQDSVGSGWYALDDSAHAPVGLDPTTPVSEDAEGRIVLHYNFTSSKIGSLVISADEGYANGSLTFGASVGSTEALISFFHPFYARVSGTAVVSHGYFGPKGGEWDAVSDIPAGTWVFTQPTESHSDTNGSGIAVARSGWDVHPQTRTGFTLTKGDVLSSADKVVVERLGKSNVLSTNVSGGSSNLFVHGLFEVTT